MAIKKLKIDRIGRIRNLRGNKFKLAGCSLIYIFHDPSKVVLAFMKKAERGDLLVVVRIKKEMDKLAIVDHIKLESSRW